MQKYGFEKEYANIVFTQPHTMKTMEKAVDNYINKDTKKEN